MVGKLPSTMGTPTAERSASKSVRDRGAKYSFRSTPLGLLHPSLRFRPPLVFASGVMLVLLFATSCQSNRPAVSSDQVPSTTVRDAKLIQFRGAHSANPEQPGDTDCNSPAHWDNGTLYVFNSAGEPWRSAGSDLFHLD